MEDKLLHKELTYEVRGILFKVHNELGRFKNEKQYCDAIEFLLKENKIPYKREFVLPTSFDGENKGRNKVDFFIADKIILEVKCVSFLNKEHYFQCQRYLNALDLDLALLVNFRAKYLAIRRILNHDRLKH